jgi:hypothetical protein
MTDEGGDHIAVMVIPAAMKDTREEVAVAVVREEEDIEMKEDTRRMPETIDCTKRSHNLFTRIIEFTWYPIMYHKYSYRCP